MAPRYAKDRCPVTNLHLGMFKSLLSLVILVAIWERKLNLSDKTSTGYLAHVLQETLWKLNFIIISSNRFQSAVFPVLYKALFYSHQKPPVHHWLTSSGEFPRHSTNFFRSSVSEIWIPFTLCSCCDSAINIQFPDPGLSQILNPFSKAMLSRSSVGSFFSMNESESLWIRCRWRITCASEKNYCSYNDKPIINHALVAIF